MENNKKKVVVVGGGTGTHTVLTGLKQYRDQIDITAVVSTADSGGSTGRLRDEFGYLPVGDVRMALVALARETDKHEHLLRDLFLHRFDKGEGLSGHNFGNLLLVALTDILGSEYEAIRAAGKVLRVHGRVEPVTHERVDLVATYADGVTLVGEHVIDEPDVDRDTHPITNLTVRPQAALSASAQAALMNADLIVLGPGDLYTSVLANVVVDGFAEALKETHAKIVYVCNLVTKMGQTSRMGSKEHLEKIIEYTKRVPDCMLINTGELPPDLVERYAQKQEFPVEHNYTGDCAVVTDNFLATEAVQTVAGDVIQRSYIRHDSHVLAKHLIDLV